jgi:UDP-2,3-diacylglucosamine hydrolase
VYVFKGEKEPLYEFVTEFSKSHEVDYYIFGHYHADVDMPLPDGARLMILKDWIYSSPYLCFDGESFIKGISQE